MQTTFLTEDQIWGGSALDVIKKYGTKTALTDLAIALGGYMGSGSTTSEGDKAGYVWSASAHDYGRSRRALRRSRELLMPLSAASRRTPRFAIICNI